VLLATRTGRASATQFQIYMAAMNLGDVAGSALAGGLAAAVPSSLVAVGVALVFLIGTRVARTGGG
jgi:PAT family beta-lactamase induction signal transducer AmpG